MQQIASHVLRTNSPLKERVVIDRSWSRQAKRHEFEVAVTNETGGIVLASVITTSDKRAALAEFLRIVAEWGEQGAER